MGKTYYRVSAGGLQRAEANSVCSSVRGKGQGCLAWAEGRPIDAVYATHLRRTQLTAAPLAAARDLDLRVLPAGDTARLLARLRAAHCGGEVLVVGHSNTVPELAQLDAWGTPLER